MMIVSSQRRLVVIDDDEANCNLLREGLSTQGWEVYSETSAHRGIALIKEKAPDLVLLDQDMPEMSGVSLLKELRAMENYTAVIFISADDQTTTVTQALDEGADDYIRKPFSMLELIARIKVRFRIKDLHEELKAANAQLDQLAHTDELTNLFNMRHMFDRISDELKRCKRHGTYLSCIMLDLDHLKPINDNYGHLMGAFVIQEAGKMIRSCMRRVDFAARYGGDEFLIILRNTDEEGTHAFCERLRAMFDGHVFDNGTSQVNLITTSIGYACTRGSSDLSPRDLVAVADHALYESKETGRNRVKGYGPKTLHTVLQGARASKRVA
jgi:diguanylate cyclase (GGDEF)-like protein